MVVYAVLLLCLLGSPPAEYAPHCRHRAMLLARFLGCTETAEVMPKGAMAKNRYVGAAKGAARAKSSQNVGIPG